MKVNKSHIAYKSLAILGTIWLSAFVYKKVYWIPELKDQGHMLFRLLDYQRRHDMIYLGESSNYWTDPKDKDKRMISEMINANLTGISLIGTQLRGIL